MYAKFTASLKQTVIQNVVLLAPEEQIETVKLVTRFRVVRIYFLG